ncbi:MAG: exodeoxyribonuclease VII large subunit [Deltaproteobacteria bacterium]|nr:exodeoxyribonuclease VII large subunit [Deltaproteobacteria bacterium]
MEHADDHAVPSSGAKPRVYSVSSLTGEIKALLETHFEFLWVEGEISNFRAPISGHYYMSLKDEKAQIRAVMFRPQARTLRFVPEDGMRVLAQGRVGVYEPRGEYQIILDYLEPLGVGALAIALERLKRKLAEQGLFDEALKKRLPYLPQKIAVITSPTGAAIRDFLRILHRRFSNTEVVVVPVKVQGQEAADEIVEAIRVVNRFSDVDVIVLTRGGGSLEDLWAFNEERVALAIRGSTIPVVSAVGHEIDMTISDLAADLRAPTPSAAAELLVPEKEVLNRRLVELGGRLKSGIAARLETMRQRVLALTKGMRDPRKRLADMWMRLDELGSRLVRSTGANLRETRARLSSEARALLLNAPSKRIDALFERIGFQRRSLVQLALRRLRDQRMALSRRAEKLKDVSPMTILGRGYSITRKLPEGRILSSVSGLEKGDLLGVTLAQGDLQCVVEKVGE